MGMLDHEPWTFDSGHGERPGRLGKVASLIVLLGIGAALLAVVTSCDRKSVGGRTEILYAMPMTLAAAPAYVALDKGFWKDEGLDVKAQMFSAGRLALDALLSKSAEVMSVSETPLMHSIRHGSRIFIVTTVTRHHEAKVLARADRGVRSAADLRGKRIGTLGGTNSDFFLSRLLTTSDIPRDSVRITNLEPPDMVSAFVRGDIDAYAAWEPHIYYGRSKLPLESTLLIPPGNLYRGFQSVAMNQDYVQAHPDVVEKLIRGFLKAVAYIKDNRDEAIGIVAARTGVDSAAIGALWEEYEFEVELNDDLLTLLQDEAEWASASDGGQGLSMPDFSMYIYAEALRRVSPSSVTLTK